MKGVRRFLGIAREAVYSPGKVEDDRAILDAVAARLRQRGHDVGVVEGEADWPQVDPRTVVFAMCQGPAALTALGRLRRAGVRVVNTPDAIAACHRRRTLEAFAAHGIRHPESAIVSTGDAELPEWIDGGAWVKRGDVHAVAAEDVAYVVDRTAAARALDAFRARGIDTAVVQHHVAGDVIKFYAVRDGFFAAFAPPESASAIEPDEEAAMRALALRGAAALGLEVFGGDVVRERAGVFALIDLNDWPSYARCRARGADAISAYLDAPTE